VTAKTLYPKTFCATSTFGIKNDLFSHVPQNVPQRLTMPDIWTNTLLDVSVIASHLVLRT